MPRSPRRPRHSITTTSRSAPSSSRSPSRSRGHRVTTQRARTSVRSDRPRRAPGHPRRRGGARAVAARRLPGRRHPRTVPHVRRSVVGRPDRGPGVRRRRPEGGCDGVALPPGPGSPPQPRVPRAGGSASRGVQPAPPIVLRRPALTRSPWRGPGRSTSTSRGIGIVGAVAPPVSSSTESCQSGRMGRSRKPLRSQGLRGFESLTLRS